MDISELRDHLERHHREGYGWALNCCSRNPVDAEDVLQTVYVKILEGKARYDGRAAFKTWLFAVIRNTAASERRRRALSLARLVAFDEQAAHAAGEDGFDESLARSQLQVFFQHALTTLPGRQREVLLLVFYHDLSLLEAADVMGVSIGSARTHYERGKKRLRQWMEVSESADGLRTVLPRPAAGG